MISHSQKSSVKNITLPFFCKMSWHRFLLFSLSQAVVNQIKPFAGISPIVTAESSHLAESWLRHAKYLLLLLPILGFFEIQEEGAAQNRYVNATHPPVPEKPSMFSHSLGKSITFAPRQKVQQSHPLNEQPQCSQPL